MSDSIIRNPAGYPTSRDYRKLWDLARRQSVICIVDHGGGAQRDLSAEDEHPPCRDVAHTITSSDGLAGLSVSARGISYVYMLPEKTADDFAQQCEAVNLEWVVPAREVSP